MFPFLFTKEIKDQFAQENFLRIADYFAADPFTSSHFQFFEFVVPAISGRTTTYPYTSVLPHNLGFQPKDVLLLHNLNNATLTWNYADFTETNISFTVSAATTIRALIGRYA